MQTPDTERTFLLFGLSPYERSLKGVWLLLGYYLFAIVFGAVMAAPSYWFLEWLYSVWPTEFLAYLLDHTLDCFFERMRVVPLLLGLPWIMWMCRLLSLRALGFAFSWKTVRSACAWACLGFALLALLAAGQVYFGVAELRAGDSAPFALKLLTALSGAVAVAFLEELIFRGIVLRIFYTAFGALWAVLLSSAFYAYTHFKVPGQLLDVMAGDTSFLSGFRVGFWTLCGIGYSAMQTPLDFALTFLTLFGLGTAIGQVFLKAKTLLPCVGLHAGVVFAMILYQQFYDTAHPSVFWGHAGFRNGVAALIIVIAMNAVVYGCLRRLPRGESASKS